jgi:ABC-type multidrug transport system fused ATPase/permease subunit
MLIRFISLPSALQFLGWAGLGLLLTAAGYALVRMLFPQENAHPHNGELGTIIAAMGMFFGLIISTMLAQAVNHFNAAVEATNHEANLSASLYRMAAQASPELAKRVQGPLLRYLQKTTLDEWPKQSSGLPVARGSPDLADISRILGDYQPDTAKQLAYLNLTQQELAALYAARHARLSNRNMTIPIVIWGVTLMGEMTLIVFGWLMHIQRKRMQFVLVSGIAMSISIALAATLIFDTPFHGDISVSDEPYLQATRDIQTSSFAY